jgi:hypothetical protein
MTVARFFRFGVECPIIKICFHFFVGKRSHRGKSYRKSRLQFVFPRSRKVSSSAQWSQWGGCWRAKSLLDDWSLQLDGNWLQRIKSIYKSTAFIENQHV